MQFFADGVCRLGLEVSDDRKALAVRFDAESFRWEYRPIAETFRRFSLLGSVKIGVSNRLFRVAEQTPQRWFAEESDVRPTVGR